MATTVGENIRRLRTDAGWTQFQLAQRIGVRDGDVCNWENDTRIPTLKHLVLIADQFRVPLDTLVGRELAEVEQ